MLKRGEREGGKGQGGGGEHGCGGEWVLTSCMVMILGRGPGGVVVSCMAAVCRIIEEGAALIVDGDDLFGVLTLRRRVGRCCFISFVFTIHHLAIK